MALRQRGEMYILRQVKGRRRGEGWMGTVGERHDNGCWWRTRSEQASGITTRIRNLLSRLFVISIPVLLVVATIVLVQ